VATGARRNVGTVSAAVVIFSWSGEQLLRLTAQQLGIQQDYYVRAAVYNDRKQTLQLAVTRDNNIVLHICLVSHITHPGPLTLPHSPHTDIIRVAQLSQGEISLQLIIRRLQANFTAIE